MASAEKRRKRRRPFLESAALPIWVMVLAVVLALVVYLVLKATITQTYLAHLGFVSLVTFLVFALDKWRAGRAKRRASELNLMVLGALGGAAGGVLAMAFLRHKTQHNLFKVGMPVLLFVHLVFLALLVLG